MADGCDAGTYRNDFNVKKPGCPDQWCDPDDPWANNYAKNNIHGANMPCGFQDPSPRAWKPRDLKTMLTLHKEDGHQYAQPGWHSGCAWADPEPTTDIIRDSSRALHTDDLSPAL